jgi:hypothetical protein
MQTLTTTMSFRAAWRFGCAHLAGQGVRLMRRAGTGFDVFIIATGERIGSVYYPYSMRERGGVQRDAETRLPRRHK